MKSIQQILSSQPSYSKSLRKILDLKLALSPKHHQKVNKMQTQIQTQKKQQNLQLQLDLKQLRKSKKQYIQQIDNVIKQYVTKQNIHISIPPIMKKNNYHNYRIVTERTPSHYIEPLNQQNQQLSKLKQHKKRTKTEAQFEIHKTHHLETNKSRNLYQFFKHYKVQSLKNIDLHINMNSLKNKYEKDIKISTRPSGLLKRKQKQIY